MAALEGEEQRMADGEKKRFDNFAEFAKEYSKARQARAGKEGMPITGAGGPPDSRYMQQGSMGMMGWHLEVPRCHAHTTSAAIPTPQALQQRGLAPGGLPAMPASMSGIPSMGGQLGRSALGMQGPHDMLDLAADISRLQNVKTNGWIQSSYDTAQNDRFHSISTDVCTARRVHQMARGPSRQRGEQERQQREQQQQQQQQRQREEELRQREEQLRQREQQLQREQQQQREEQERAREEQDRQRVSSEDNAVPVVSMEILDLDPRPLAVGSFKDVHEARLRRDAPGIGNAGLKVAVLQLRHGTATLAAELQVFKTLGRHPNLTRLFAVVVNDSRNVSCLVTEFAELGSLDNVLMSLEERGENATAAVLVTAAIQTLEAMQQLQEFQIVPCDLALRNLLAFEFHPEETTQVKVKLTDYGLASTGTYAQKATSSVGNGLPFRWMSTEAIERRRFSGKSDVWAFGVVLWEMFTHGMVPYTLISSDSAVAERVIAGDRLERPLRPTECPEGVFSTMQKCWITQVRDRPTFAHVKNLILHDFPKEGECCICLHKFSLGNLLALLPCGHRCVCREHAAIVSGATCPLCKRVVTGAICVFDLFIMNR